MLPKCKHGVYVPGGPDGAVSEYCSICTPLHPLPEGKVAPNVVTSPLPYGERKCPDCGSIRFVYRDEWDFHCKDCGLDALDD